MTGPDEKLRLELLSMSHAAVLEAFERDNRAFFAARIGDRGDDFFTHFPDRLADRVDENDARRSLFYVVVDGTGDIVARINLSDIDEAETDQTDGAELGYRVAESAQGRGVATWGVAHALDRAVDHGVHRVTARVATTNCASQRVLEHCGFSVTGPTDAPAGSVEDFLGYRKEL